MALSALGLIDAVAYQAFLVEIDYLEPAVENFSVYVSGVDGGATAAACHTSDFPHRLESLAPARVNLGVSLCRAKH